MDLKGHPLYGSHSDMSYFHYQANYMRNSRAIGVLWAVFTMCFAIINAVVFIQPQWLGDTETSKGTGYFGLWKSCRLLQDGQDLICDGRLDDFGSIPSAAFRAATVFTAISVVLILLALISMVLFLFLHSSTVFHICAWLQTACATCMLIGVVVFPAGWDSPAVKEVCGSDAMSYSPGQCSVRWAYILAMIGVVDCVVLAVLAFILGSRYVRSLPEQYLNAASAMAAAGVGAGGPGSIYKGELNGAFLTDMIPSRKGSLVHHNGNGMPVMVLPGVAVHDPERFSEYSHKTGGRVSQQHRNHPSGAHGYPNGTHFSVNNFQL